MAKKPFIPEPPRHNPGVNPDSKPLTEQPHPKTGEGDGNMPPRTGNS